MDDLLYYIACLWCVVQIGFDVLDVVILPLVENDLEQKIRLWLGYSSGSYYMNYFYVNLS